MPKKVKKGTYTVRLEGKISKVIDEIAEDSSISKSEVLRRALALYSYLGREMGKGDVLILRDKSDNEKEIILKDI